AAQQTFGRQELSPLLQKELFPLPTELHIVFQVLSPVRPSFFQAVHRTHHWRSPSCCFRHLSPTSLKMYMGLGSQDPIRIAANHSPYSYQNRDVVQTEFASSSPSIQANSFPVGSLNIHSFLLPFHRHQPGIRAPRNPFPVHPNLFPNIFVPRLHQIRLDRR